MAAQIGDLLKRLVSALYRRRVTDAETMDVVEMVHRQPWSTKISST
jgi:acetylglutamate kinase